MTTATYLLTLPADAATTGNFLTTNGLDTISWSSLPYRIVQTASTIVTSVAHCVDPFITNVDTIPSNTAGDQVMSLSITPINSANYLFIEVLANVSVDSVAAETSAQGIGLYRNSETTALQAGAYTRDQALGLTQLMIVYILNAAATSSQTFAVRAGQTTGTSFTTFNGQNNTRLYGGVCASSIMIREFTVT